MRGPGCRSLAARRFPVLCGDAPFGVDDVLAEVLPRYVLLVASRVLVAATVMPSYFVEELCREVVARKLILERGTKLPAMWRHSKGSEADEQARGMSMTHL